MLVPDSSWGSYQLFGKPNLDTEGHGFSDLAFELLQVLYNEYPDQTAVCVVNCSIIDNLQINQIWNWLVDLGIVSGTPSCGALTGSGLRAFHVAVRQKPELRGLRRAEGNVQPVRRASAVMLSMLRAHAFDRPSKTALT